MSDTMTKFEWTEELAELALKLSAEGRSASEIATVFGTTRNVIIGKTNRERIKRGLHVVTPRGYGHRTPRAPVTKREPQRPSLPQVPSARSAQSRSPAIEYKMVTRGTGKHCSIVDVVGCRWPIEEDHSLPGKHLFCNEARRVDRPYCEHHVQLAGAQYQKWTPLDDRKLREEWNGGRGKSLLAQILRRTKASIEARAKQLGLGGIY